MLYLRDLTILYIVSIEVLMNKVKTYFLDLPFILCPQIAKNKIRA